MKTLAIKLEYNYCCYVIVAVSAVIWIKKLRFANLKMQVVHIQQRVVHIIETIHGNKTKQTIIKKKIMCTYVVCGCTEKGCLYDVCCHSSCAHAT